MENRNVVMVLAQDLEGNIGLDDRLPWSCPLDLKLFRRLTIGNVVIMGRKTYESVGSKPLPKRFNIVVSTRLEINEVDVISLPTLEQALAYAKSKDLDLWDDYRLTTKAQVIVMGGVSIYDQAIDQCDEFVISTINSHPLPSSNSSYVGAEFTAKLHDWLRNKGAVDFTTVHSYQQLEDDVLQMRSGSFVGWLKDEVNTSSTIYLKQTKHYILPPCKIGSLSFG